MSGRKAIQHIVIDSTKSFTELCELGKKLGIDKSPYNVNPNTHKHPYTSVYSMLFGPLKNKEIHFAEIGVAAGGSVILWNQYFNHPSTRFHFFDCDENFLNHSRSFGFTRSSFDLMDVGKDGNISQQLSPYEKYDVILDDSSHNFNDQVRIVKEAFPFVKSGGYMIVEDVFRNIPEEDFERELKDILPLCSEAYFVMCEHTLKNSIGWDNDKILVLVKQ